MSARLTTAIKIAESANAVLQRVNSFDLETARSCEGWDLKAHIGIDPMLLALAMELALKAWYVFDHDTTKVIRSHNLAKLFVGLKPESQNKLDTAFRRSVAPNHPILFDTDYGILDVLEHHAEAFVDWRYLYENQKPLSFNQSAFVATLEMVLHEFRKRYRVERVEPPWDRLK